MLQKMYMQIAPGAIKGQFHTSSDHGENEGSFLSSQ